MEATTMYWHYIGFRVFFRCVFVVASSCAAGFSRSWVFGLTVGSEVVANTQVLGSSYNYGQ